MLVVDGKFINMVMSKLYLFGMESREIGKNSSECKVSEIVIFLLLLIV